MTKKQLKEIIDTLEDIYTEDERMNKAWKDFIWVLAPFEYAPIMDWRLESIFSVLKITYPEITELLEYYFYEAKNMDWAMVESDWKKYNYNNVEEVIQSMIDFGHMKN